ncbi:MAG TPA: hypothetical protein DD730_08510 [Desulfosporosinus sp.]|jgi:hypothetical protein|nr:hypothetical protein [Desulfosporosinus sp.]
MSLFKKIKTIRKRWYLLLIIVVIIGGSAAVRINHSRQNKTLATAKMGSQVNRQVDTDLVLLETFASAKVTPVQAKVILPLMEKLSTATDPTVQSDLAKQVYGLLTPAQYSILMDSQNINVQSTNQPNQGDPNSRNNKGGKEIRSDKGHDFGEGNSFEGKNFQDPKEQALSNVVLKMLNDRSAEQIPPKV